MILASIYGPSSEVDDATSSELTKGSLALSKANPLDVVIEKIVNGGKV